LNINSSELRKTADCKEWIREKRNKSTIYIVQDITAFLISKCIP
jgi:hypothetical protein